VRYNWVDVLTIGIVATAAGIQFLRGTRSFSRILYETVLLIAGLIGATALYDPVHRLLGISEPVAYLIVFVLLGAVAFLAGAGVNRLMPFALGMFGHILSLGVGVACGWVFGHAILRMMVGIDNPQLHSAIRHSWMASQVLHFGAFIELLAMLRLARWHRI